MSFKPKGDTERQVPACSEDGGDARCAQAQEQISQGMQLAENVLPMDVPLLFIDASAPLVQAGVWQGGRWLAYRCVEAPALEEIFRSVSLLLKEAGLAFADLRGFIHNEGPGSILGIRLAAMALRIWSMGLAGSAEAAGGASALESVGTAGLPVWAVRSLPLMAAKVALVGAGGVFSEFRQGLWNWYTPCADDVFGDGIEVIETEELAERLARAPERCWHLRHRKSWEAPPVAVREIVADLSDCPQVLLQPGLLRRVAEPEALLTRAPEFKTASGERHRGAQPAATGTGGQSAFTSADGQQAFTDTGQQPAAEPGTEAERAVDAHTDQPLRTGADQSTRADAASPTGKPLSGGEPGSSQL